ncbi:MAG: type II toxin-antitoxin system RelE/ParE family toxin [Pirellulales bacterium]
MSYAIDIRDVAYDELQAIKPFYRRRIVDAIGEQLAHEPTVETKNRKILVGFHPHFEHEDPVWELRVGEYRVYYDVNETGKTVLVRAIRKKPPHTTTEQIA